MLLSIENEEIPKRALYFEKSLGIVTDVLVLDADDC